MLIEVGFYTAMFLTIVFIVLKVIGVIAWSWIGVFSPFLIFVVGSVLLVLTAGIGGWFDF